MWDYKKLQHEWNSLPLDNQLNLLQEHYPIGYRFYYINTPTPGGLDITININSKSDHSDYECEILGYLLIKDSEMSWYILSIKNIGETINIREGKEYETFHPGFFYPNREFIRERKLDIIGI